MAKTFKRQIPRIPFFKRNFYEIPSTYSEKYIASGIKDLDEQKALFYLTQFGGFRLKKLPSYFFRKENFFSKWFKCKNEEGYRQFKASPLFISQFGSLIVQPLLKINYSQKIYEDSFLEENNVDIEEARQIERFLFNLNLFYREHRVGLEFPLSGLTIEDRLDVSRFNSIPHFQYKPKAGNRLFHSGPGTSFQRISSNLRPSLTINGEKTTEIDISASTIQFLDIVLRQIGFDSKDLKQALVLEDPYQHFLTRINMFCLRGKEKDNGNLNRDALKKLFYTLIYSNLVSQERNVNRYLRLNYQNYFYSDLQEEFSDFFEALKMLKLLPSKNRIGDKKETLPAYQTIFREESRFARDILLQGCLNEGIPILPLHDSFIVPLQHYLDLERIVCDTSIKRYGRVFHHKTKY